MQISRILSTAVMRSLPLVDKRLASSTTPLPAGYPMRPHHDSKLWAWTHYGVFIPSLPSPHRFLNTMTLIGATGTEIFDNDMLAAADVRNTSTVFSSTAAGENHHYRAYDLSRDCEFADDGSSLRWGDHLHLTISGDVTSGGEVIVRGRYDDFSVDVTVRPTDAASFFVDTPIYQHLSLLAPYTGTITDASGTTEISGLGTFEYARALGHQALSSRPLPANLKLPMDFFTYQIIQLDEQTQLLLTDVSARGQNACRLVHVRTLGKPAEVYDNVDFTTTFRAEPEVDEFGREMRIPETLTWTVRDGGREILRIDGTVDSPLRYGHGRGYAGAYSYTGVYRGVDVAGDGYMEWVDARQDVDVPKQNRA
ncbi:hypothetical protein ACH46_00515 [Gordonia phthalatica]|uniref:AttH domain-containing protein n=2 Tax=Gordonia phthalatica TaxID=1136941 RepID=A0A0N9NDQ3_9ACTN|nr:DUF6670 family protein [Gordonia phthalatica]ALG83268.1 hypothetical protein ACH46_00515 [Gordonia phthalatica]